MTEEIAATPGWVESRLNQVFSSLPETPDVYAACQSYAECLASRKAPGAPSDMLGAEFTPCDKALQLALRAAGIEVSQATAIKQQLEALEAEIAGGS